VCPTSVYITMAKLIRLNTCLIFLTLLLVSFFIPLPVRTIGGSLRLVPAAILDLYQRTLADYHSQEKWQAILTLGFLVVVHLTVLTLVTLLIDMRLREIGGRKTHRATDDA